MQSLIRGYVVKRFFSVIDIVYKCVSLYVACASAALFSPGAFKCSDFSASLSYRRTKSLPWFLYCCYTCAALSFLYDPFLEIWVGMTHLGTVVRHIFPPLKERRMAGWTSAGGFKPKWLDEHTKVMPETA